MKYWNNKQQKNKNKVRKVPNVQEVGVVAWSDRYLNNKQLNNKCWKIIIIKNGIASSGKVSNELINVKVGKEQKNSKGWTTN
jgi:hypothetical protein